LAVLGAHLFDIKFFHDASFDDPQTICHYASLETLSCAPEDLLVHQSFDTAGCFCTLSHKGRDYSFLENLGFDFGTQKAKWA
jgi:hypothetical protein